MGDIYAPTPYTLYSARWSLGALPINSYCSPIDIYIRKARTESTEPANPVAKLVIIIIRPRPPD